MTKRSDRGTLRCNWLVIAVGFMVLVALFLPWGVSAYHTERAGGKLEAEALTDEEYRSVEHSLQEALRWHPGNTYAYRLLAQSRRRQGDWPAAVEAMASYVALRPNNPVGYWELAATCEQLNVMELAHVTGQPCGTDGTSRQAALARFWQAAGQSSDSFVRAGDDQREIGDWEQASAHYRRALLLNPQSAPAWYGQAEVFRARHQEGEALETFARVLALSSDPDLRAKTHNARGEILAGALLWSKASDELDHAVQLAPDQGLYHLNYGWYLHKAGDHPQQARAELTRAAGLLPENPLPHLRLADLDFADGDYAGMLVHAQTAIEIQPALFWSWVSQGRALRYLNRLAEGEQALRHAVELAPDEAVPRIELGHTFAQQGYWDRAINEYEQAILLAPGDLQHYMILGNAYRANGQRSQAVETYQSVLKLDPENAAARQALQELGH